MAPVCGCAAENRPTPGTDHAGGDARAHGCACCGHVHGTEERHGLLDGRWFRLALAYGILLGLVRLSAVFLPAWTGRAALAAALVGLVPMAFRAVRAAFGGRPFAVEVLMTVSCSGAVAIGAVDEAAMVILLFLVGEGLEDLAAERSRAGIRHLASLVPDRAAVEDDSGRLVETRAEDLAPGMVIVVGAGERVAADGTVLSGESAMDESPVTGESLPVGKSAGSAVFAGSVNGGGVLRIRVDRSGEDGTIARIVRLVAEAEESGAPVQRLIDRFSRFYTPVVILVGLLVAVLPPLIAGADWRAWIYRALAVLLIGCPCALVISTPAAVAAALAAGAKRGLLVKSGAALETLGRVDALAVDKTGTLTCGRPQVTDVLVFSGTRDHVLSLAVSLARGSSHPVARAIAETFREAVPVPVEDLQEVPGQGTRGTVSGAPAFLGSARGAKAAGAVPSPDQERRLAHLAAAGRSVVLVAHDGAAVGVIAFGDTLREDAESGVGALKRLGIALTMLTGDVLEAARPIAERLEIPFRSGLLPEDKMALVRDLKARGHVVAKIGDGINDAPALAAADVGIAMGGGTDVALETADAAILSNRIGDVAALFALARSCLATIRLNVAMALGLKAVFLVTTILGITGLWPAVLADTGATVLVTANALRLLRSSDRA